MFKNLFVGIVVFSAIFVTSFASGQEAVTKLTPRQELLLQIPEEGTMTYVVPYPNENAVAIITWETKNADFAGGPVEILETTILNLETGFRQSQFVAFLGETLLRAAVFADEADDPTEPIFMGDFINGELQLTINKTGMEFTPQDLKNRTAKILAVIEEHLKQFGIFSNEDLRMYILLRIKKAMPL